MFVVKKDIYKAEGLDKYTFSKEDNIQKLLSFNPDILLSLSDIGVAPYEDAISIREYPTSRGSIDIVFITDIGEIILVETKLLKNPESHRTVVAQAIDYAKAFSEESIETLKQKMNSKNVTYKNLLENKFWEATVDKNIKKGNYLILIVGDEIHSNIIGMVESIQSAPQLSFTIFTVSLNPYSFNENMLIFPKIEEKTTEIERSVISIEVLANNEIKIDSSSPVKGSKGNKPKISAENFLENIERTAFIDSIKWLWKEIDKMGGTIDWGVVGFSGGFRLGQKRISLIWVYDNKFNILSKRMRKNYPDLSDEQYLEYIDALKASPYIYENIVVTNKSEVYFKDIDRNDFEIAISATLQLMKKLVGEK